MLKVVQTAWLAFSQVHVGSILDVCTGGQNLAIVNTMILPSSTPRLRCTQKVGLAERRALLPQNVVGGGDVEVEVGNTPVRDVNRALELELPARNLHTDLNVLLALESILLALGVAEELHSTLDALLELLHGGLVVFDGDPLEAADARKHTLGYVAGELDLELERLHVINESGVDKLIERNIVLLGPGFGLFDVLGERSKIADKERNA